MIDALIILDDDNSPRGMVKTIPYLCRAKFQPVSGFKIEQASEASMLVMDLSLNSEANVSFIRKLFRILPDKPKIVFASRSDRQEIVQACAIGGATILGRAESKCVINLSLRKIFRDLGNPFYRVEANAAAAAAMRVDSLYADITQSAIVEAPLPESGILACARNVIDAVHGQGVDSWMDVVQKHHSHTYCHSMMVSGYAAAFGEELGLDTETINILVHAGLLHDIGKVRIPLSVLDKPGELDEEECGLVKRHPEFGREILSSQANMDERIIEVAYSHHEYLDGSGYPQGLRGDRISPLVRIITICDIFAALTEERSYKQYYSRRVAYAILLEMGAKLDRELLKKFRPVAFRSEFGELRRTVKDINARKLAVSA
ncbi:HD domain-containing protein [Rhizobiales bacterium]|uniref:HD-GYP domain-containing protein n=1 Tax=Hongsoonwoonella zoysiae TaxID=2821844 RepID=UPI001560C693|nr:HD domain-containing phosphohydrolase [Hongsoonwoonella zoysiae]NRG17409.1 HD domain-containing protein [Hongsoonwoonella zoysiae]